MQELTNITITQTPNELFMEFDGPVYALDIKFDGQIIGEVIGNNNIVGVRNNRMIIVFVGEQKEHILNYEGNLILKKAIAYTSNNKSLKAKIKIKNDEVQNIKSFWNTSNKYTDFNKTNRYNRIKKTKMTYTLQGKKIHIDHKNKRIKGIENVRK